MGNYHVWFQWGGEELELMLSYTKFSDQHYPNTNLKLLI
jgi:hypothetical protein